MIIRTAMPTVITIVALLLLFATGGLIPAAAADISVYKDAQCGCCAKWVEHLRANGFNVTTHNVASVDRIKSTHGVPAQLASCHTAIVDGYVVEGHVPADTIERLLRERPAVKGIAVPGMPAGAPGMEGPSAQRYDIMSFDAQGEAARYESR